MNINPCFISVSSTAVQALVGDSSNAFVTSDVLYTTPNYVEKMKQQKTPNHKTPNSSLVHVIPSHCKPIPCPQPARTSRASSSLCGRHLWQLDPSRFSFFSSPVTLFSLSGSPENLTFSGFQALPTPYFPPATLFSSFFKTYLHGHSSFLFILAPTTLQKYPLPAGVKSAAWRGLLYYCPKQNRLRAPECSDCRHLWHCSC